MGPRERLLFQREAVALPRSVGYVAEPDGKAGWLRAGLLQGLELGQIWGLSELLLDEQLRPRVGARVRVTELGLSRARVEPVDAEAATQLEGVSHGSSALLLDSPERRAVHVRGPAKLEAAVAASALLEPGEAEGAWAEIAWASTGEGELELRAIRREPALELHWTGSEPERALAWAVDLLEDWARVEDLLASLARAPGGVDETPLRLRWGRCEGGRDHMLAVRETAELSEGSEVYLEVAHRGLSPETWFVNVIELGVDGRQVLFDAAEPEGRAVAPRKTEYFGRRAFRFKTGRPLRWADGLEREQKALAFHTADSYVQDARIM